MKCLPAHAMVAFALEEAKSKILHNGTRQIFVLMHLLLSLKVCGNPLVFERALLPRGTVHKKGVVAARGTAGPPG